MTINDSQQKISVKLTFSIFLSGQFCTFFENYPYWAWISLLKSYETFLWAFSKKKNIQFSRIIRTRLLQEMSSYRSWHRRFTGFDQCPPIGEVGAQVRNSWKMLKQCYSITPKKQKPKQMFGFFSEICFLLKSSLFLIITLGPENGLHEKMN